MPDEKQRQQIGLALGRIPQGLFILTSGYEDRRIGMLVSWVQQACFEPPMVSVAVAKGRGILPLVSESRHFGLCQVPKGDKTLLRKFTNPTMGDDPFMGFELVQTVVPGVPILKHSLAYMVCEVTCHVDVEGDHDMFVGVVRGAGGGSGEPMIHLRENGFKY